MTTARTLVKKALQKAGVLVKNESPAADEASDGLDALNAMLASWASESLLCYARSLESFSLSQAAQYSIGMGADFDTERPSAIIAATIRWGGTDYPMAIVPPENFERFIADKQQPGIPAFLTYDGGYPVGTIRISPAPMSAYTLRLMTEKPIDSLTLDDEVMLPPGWERAIIFNLALELSPEYGTQLPQEAHNSARLALSAIKRATARARSMDAYPVGAYGVRNIYTGWW